MRMLEIFLKTNYQCENLTVYLCAHISNGFFQHLSSFITFLSQSDEEGFNTKNESKPFFLSLEKWDRS